MSNEKQSQTEERVLGRVLSKEQVKQVSGGTDPEVDTTGSGSDGGWGGVTTIARDSGVWGEGYKPMY